MATALNHIWPVTDTELKIAVIRCGGSRRNEARTRSGSRDQLMEEPRLKPVPEYGRAIFLP